MNDWDPEDETGRALASLSLHDAPPELVERIRARGAASLAARGGGEEVSAGRAASWWLWLEPVLALSLGMLYLADAVTRALEVYR